jgi:serine/alanine adding enzyme
LCKPARVANFKLEILASYKVKLADLSDRERWDEYVRQRQDGSLYHLFGWKEAIRAIYGHSTYYLILTDEGDGETYGGVRNTREKIVGILPLIHLKHVLFGNGLISLPFVDGGGVLADSQEAGQRLISEAVILGRRIGAHNIELRQESRIDIGREFGTIAGATESGLEARVKSAKVRMVLDLPESSAMLIQSFKSKLRSQINKPLKEGCTSKIGGVELLDDFYRIFLVNMRDLGSPVHSRSLIRRVLTEFAAHAKIVAVYKGDIPIAASVIIGFAGVLRNPWASADRKFASISPNMLLYLRMLEFACDNGYKAFDFGRSTPGEGTFKFKEQWGAVGNPLYWYQISLNGKLQEQGDSPGKMFEMAGHYWKKLPVKVTQIVGPRIRKHISL